jgi:hypothetical protein
MSGWDPVPPSVPVGLVLLVLLKMNYARIHVKFSLPMDNPAPGIRLAPLSVSANTRIKHAHAMPRPTLMLSFSIVPLIQLLSPIKLNSKTISSLQFPLIPHIHRPFLTKKASFSLLLLFVFRMFSIVIISIVIFYPSANSPMSGIPSHSIVIMQKSLNARVLVLARLHWSQIVDQVTECTALHPHPPLHLSVRRLPLLQTPA